MSKEDRSFSIDGGEVATKEPAPTSTRRGVVENCRDLCNGIRPLEQLHRFAAVAFFYFANLGIKALGLKMLPSSLVGMIFFFAVLLVLEQCGGSASATVFRMLEPGYRFLLKWAPLFFLPALVKLPLMEERFSANVLLGIILLLFLGWFVQLVLTAAVASLFSAREQDLQASLDTVVPLAARQLSNSPARPQLYPRPGMPFMLRWLWLYVIVMASAIASFHAGFMPDVAEDSFMVCATLFSIVAANALPPRVRVFAHPIVVTLMGSWVAAWMWAAQSGSEGFLDVLVNYSTGAGFYLSMLLQSLVVALALLLYERREVLWRDLLPILTTTFVAALSGLFGTAMLTRMILLPRVVSTAALSRFLTTPLAIENVELLGASQPIAVAIVTCNGLLAAVFGEAVLTFLRVQSAPAQGLAMGCSGAVLGAVSLTPWAPKAVPYGTVGFVLLASVSVALTSLPPVKDALLYVVA